MDRVFCCLFVVYQVYICSAGHVELPVVLLSLLRCLVYHMLSKTRRNSRSLHGIINVYICSAGYAELSVLLYLLRSMLGVSHALQNKKLWKLTQSDK